MASQVWPQQETPERLGKTKVLIFTTPRRGGTARGPPRVPGEEPGLGQEAEDRPGYI